MTQEKDETNREDELEELCAKIPTATAEVKQAINIAYAVLQQKKEGCTIRTLYRTVAERGAQVSANDVVDAVAAMMLAGKVTYIGDKSTTIAVANKKLESLIIRGSYKNPDGCTVGDLEVAAEQDGISHDDLYDMLKGQNILERIKIEGGKVRSIPARPPGKTMPSQRAEPGDAAERYYEEAALETFEPRTEFSKDYERILYSSAFRRLAGVTQVFGTSEGHVFHNRLTHSIKAGQIARSIAERSAAAAVHPDVVEAASLAHDLGHPPFGHTGESELNRLLTEEHHVDDGFEGNAQNLRIVSQLSRVRREFRGLNLTRATLNALMKYPWSREPGHQKKGKKWNTYSTEKRFFDFARSGKWGQEELRGEVKSYEAQVMEWADDIAYGVHDIEDGVRAGMIPLSELLNDSSERERFLEASKGSWEKELCFNNSKDEARAALSVLFFARHDLRRPYDDDAAQQAALSQLTTSLHHRYILAIEFRDGKLSFRRDYEKELIILKCLMQFYVFCNPVLLPQQHGHRRVVHDLFAYYLDAAQSEHSRNVLPTHVRELFDEDDSLSLESRKARAAADTVAGMTELEALAMHRVVTGTDAGRIRGRIVS